MERSSWLAQALSSRLVVCAVLVIQVALSACSDTQNVAPQVDREVLIEELVVGTGAPAQAGDTVLFNYVGYVPATSEVFDNSYERGLPLEVIAGQKGTNTESAIISNNRASGEVITGLARGLVGVRVGGRRIISVPQELAYGGCAGTVGNIPQIVCSADYLAFEVTVLAIRF